MDVNSLMAVTMGMAFYFIPLVLLIGTLLFVIRWRARVEPESGPKSPFPKEAIKDPLIVSVVLLLSGVGTVAFLTGRFSGSDYFSVPIDAVGVLGNAFTDWEDPLAAESIALKGGVLIALACTIVVLFSVLSHYRRRLQGESSSHDYGSSRQ